MVKRILIVFAVALVPLARGVERATAFPVSGQLRDAAQPDLARVAWICKPSYTPERVCRWAPPFYFPVEVQRTTTVVTATRQRARVLAPRRTKRLIVSRSRCPCAARTAKRKAGVRQVRILRRTQVRTLRRTETLTRYDPFYPPPPSL